MLAINRTLFVTISLYPGIYLGTSEMVGKPNKMLNVNSMTDQHEFMGKYFDSWLLDGTETRGKRRIDEPLGSEAGFLVREKFK